MNADGTDERRLTSFRLLLGGRDGPSWSPDGTMIAFASKRDGNYEIYIMNADGTAQTRLTYNETFDWAPSWSPFLSAE